MHGRRSLERGEIAGAMLSKAEVAADQQPTRAERLHQNLLDEALNR
jgi:hypothetical protein